MIQQILSQICLCQAFKILYPGLLNKLMLMLD